MRFPKYLPLGLLFLHCFCFLTPVYSTPAPQEDVRSARRLRAEAAYQEMKGNTEAAIIAYRKSLEHLPDPEIETRIAKLEGTELEPTQPTSSQADTTPDTPPAPGGHSGTVQEAAAAIDLEADPSGQHFAWARQFFLSGPEESMPSDPQAMAMDSLGRILILDSVNDRPGVCVFSPEGTLIHRWGSKGEEPGQLSFPRSMTVTPQDEVYIVSSYGSQLIQVFDTSGNLLRRMGTPGKEPGQLDNPFGLAVAKDGRLFLIEAPYSSKVGVHVLSPEGESLAFWGKSGRAEGEFRESRGIALDNQGNIYVADRGNARIQKLAPDGTFLKSWGRYGKGNGQFSGERLFITPRDEIFFIDGGNARLQFFDADGQWLGKLGRWGTGPGAFDFLNAATVSRDGLHILTLDQKNRIQEFVRTSQPPPPELSQQLLSASWTLPKGSRNFSVAPDGSIIAVVPDPGMILSIAPDAAPDADPIRLLEDQNLALPSAAIMDEKGQLWVIEAAYQQSQIRLFSQKGEEVLRFGQYGDSEMDFLEPVDMAFLPNGNLVVCDVMKSCALLFSPQGEWLGNIGQKDPAYSSWRGSLITDGLLAYPEGIGTDSSGRVYLADKNNHTVQLFDAEGTFLSRLGNQGSGPGEFSFPRDVAVSASGWIAIADNSHDRVQVFSQDQHFLLSFGLTGDGPGEFCGPIKLVIDGDNRLHVLDEQGRVQRFDPLDAHL